MSKIGSAMESFLFDTFAGDHDKDLAELCKAHTGPLGLIRWSDLDGKAGQTWRDLQRQLGLHKQAVSITDTTPTTGVRALKRAISSGDAPAGESSARREEVEAERLDTWRQTQDLRKKIAHVMLTRASTPTEWQRWLESAQVAHRFTGKAGESHRVFVLSADTFGREGETPWFNVSDAGEKELDAVLRFMTQQTGPSDVLLFFDGRSASNRKTILKHVDSARHVCEVWIVYAPQKRAGRRVAWASESRETGWISLPISRTMIATKARQDDVAAGWAPTTHESAYVGVPAARWDNVPTITLADKQQVFPGGSASTPPPENVFVADHGVPLFWQEKKPVALWEDILTSLDAKMVVDLSPGSGAAGRACLRKSIPYVAACRTDAHRTWLGNALDREACVLITTDESPLVETDLAEIIKTHFQDVLDQMAEMQRDEEPAVEAEEGEEGEAE